MHNTTVSLCACCPPNKGCQNVLLNIWRSHFRSSPGNLKQSGNAILAVQLSGWACTVFFQPKTWYTPLGSLITISLLTSKHASVPRKWASCFPEGSHLPNLYKWRKESCVHFHMTICYAVDTSITLTHIFHQEQSPKDTNKNSATFEYYYLIQSRKTARVYCNQVTIHAGFYLFSIIHDGHSTHIDII